MDDISESIEEIYESVGDFDRWQRLRERLAAVAHLSPELEHHLEMARRAHEKHIHLAAGIDELASVHDQLALGALVLDRDRLLLRANVTASSLLADGDGLILVAHRVGARDTHDDARLQRAVERAAIGMGDESDLDMTLVAVRRVRREPLSVLVLHPTNPALRFFEDRLPVTLLVIDPDLSAVPSGDTLRTLYGFTAREAEFGALLMRGLSVKDASVALGVSMTTGRTFLAQISAKTDSHSQAELMMRLLAIPRTRIDR